MFFVIVLCLALLPSTFSLLIPPAAANCTTSKCTSKCGDIPFNPAWYSCYTTNNGSALCPIVANIPLDLCNHDCYTPLQYSCNNLTLNPLPKYTGPVSLTALNPAQPFHNQPVQAAGQRFVIGGTAATYCPSSLPEGVCPNLTTTVLYGSGTGLATLVPGGQSLYIRPDGSIGFTQAHSIFVPAGSYQGAIGTAYSNAGFWGMNGSSWYACEAEGKGEGWYIYSGLFTKSWNGSQCEEVMLKVENLPMGTLGAWQYI
ncbi:unnamed protein product [Zymoseptoria tritici ST99CH_1E4]|uniref:Endo-1,3(4)-beta-glucanase 1 carbohydrate binding domain-containing protein n=1 Tax=Zymoseptoria tritici ST99CH_1E4 TaxID=1276532 RepID=A0A2H1GHQ4_ZYMTR|nr:unnamed protein product [Zymoseptoria tritici ST99CH_1E4]